MWSTPRVELAGNDREVVVHQLGAHARADAAAMMDGRAHGVEHRLDAGERLVARADHEERLASLGVTGETSDRRVRELTSRGRRRGRKPIRHDGIDRAHVDHDASRSRVG